MSTVNFTYHSDVVLEFKEIPEKDYSRQIYFIEKNHNTIREMEDLFRIDLFDKYSKALLETCHFRKCVNALEPLIFDVLDSNYKSGEEDLFYKLLLRKSEALYQLGEFENSEHVAKELVKIDPSNSASIKILRNAKCRIIKEKTAGLRALVVMFFLFGLGITCFDLLIIQNFFPEHASPIILVRNTLMLIAGISLIGIELASVRVSKYYCNRFQREQADKKSII